MSGIEVSVKLEVLNWILQRIRTEDVPSSAVELLTDWQSGEKTPAFDEVEEVSREIHIPFGYFFLDQPLMEHFPLMEYRTVKGTADSEPSRELIDTVDQMMEIQDWETECLQENGCGELSFVGSVDSKVSSESIAESIRKHLHLSPDWFVSCRTTKEAFQLLRSRLEDCGVLVMTSGIARNDPGRVLNIKEFRAFTIMNRYAPLIFINSVDTETGKLFSLMHETVHVWLGVNSLYNDRNGHAVGVSEIDVKCNEVAAELLGPAGKPGYWRSEGEDSSGVLTDQMDHRFLRALLASVEEGKTSYTDLLWMTNTDRGTFRKWLSGQEVV